MQTKARDFAFSSPIESFTRQANLSMASKPPQWEEAALYWEKAWESASSSNLQAPAWAFQAIQCYSQTNSEDRWEKVVQLIEQVVSRFSHIERDYRARAVEVSWKHLYQLNEGQSCMYPREYNDKISQIFTRNYQWGIRVMEKVLQAAIKKNELQEGQTPVTLA